jgi:conserved oligomeric Golgi complex subunit 2
MAPLAINSPIRPASSYSAAFNLGSSSSSSAGDDDDAPLPFPAALPRSDFLAPDFHAATYLSNLPHRHQTLEDLRADLRDRSAAISAELLELVNANYTAFLSLGNELRGGDEKIEDVKVAMLGFRRSVDEVKGRVRIRGLEVQGLNENLRGVRSDIEVARRMLELDERLLALEDRLALTSTPTQSKDHWVEHDSDDGDEEGSYGEGVVEGLIASSPSKLVVLAREYVRVERLAHVIGRQTPLVIKMEPRMMRCKNTILLDLSNALKEARQAGARGNSRVIRYLGIYAMLGADADAIKALKSK